MTRTDPVGEPAAGRAADLGGDAGAEPRWLDAEEREAWVGLASVLMLLPAALDAQLQRDAGISHFEYGILSRLSEATDRALRMSHLADRSDVTLQRLSQAVGRLEKRGWVRRSQLPTDRRVTLATLTEQGWDKVVATAPGHVEAVRRYVLDPLTKAQARHLAQIGQRIVKSIDLDTCNPGNGD